MCVHNVLLYCVYTLCMHKHNKCLSQHHKISAQNILFVNEYLKKWVVSNRGSSTEGTCRCGRVSHVFCRPINVFVFDILQITSGWIAPTCMPLAMGLSAHYCFSFSYLSNDVAAHSGGQYVVLSAECTVTNRNKRKDCLQLTWGKIQWWVSNRSMQQAFINK